MIGSTSPSWIARRAGGVGAFALLLAISLLIRWPVFGLLPISNHDLYILGWADTTPPGVLVFRDTLLHPHWRPLGYVAVWLEYQLLHLDAVAAYYAVNLLLWVASSWLVYVIVEQLARSKAAAMLAAVAVLTDTRALYTHVWIVENQNSLACVFGLAALLVVVRADDRRLGRARLIGVGLLLLASAFSKEYGVAFAVALAAHAVLQRRSDLAWVSGLAIAVYTGLRLTVGGPVWPYCEDMAFFFQLREVCLDPSTAESRAQLAYNVAIAAVGIPLQGLLSEEGLLRLDWARMATAGVFLVPAALAVVRGSASVRLIAWVPLVTVPLSALIYRDRNHLIGVCTIGILSGIGLTMGRRLIDAPIWRYAATALLVALLTHQSLRTRDSVRSEVRRLDDTDPCESTIGPFYPYGLSFITKTKLRYGMADPYCTGQD